jgi:TM2 domain-containing membrane protein YozV
MLGKIAVLIISLILLLVGANEAYEGWKNREAEPTRITVADYVKSDKSKKWVVLTDAKINLLHAVTVTTTTTTTHGQQVTRVPVSNLYIPIESAGFTQNDTVSLLLETDNEEILNVVHQMKAMSGEKSEAKLLEFIVRERDKLIRSVELSGLVESESSMESSRAQEIRKHIKNLASYFYILKHNSSATSEPIEGLIIMGIGLFMLILSIFSFVGSKEASENLSKPETRAAYTEQKMCITCNALIHQKAEICPKCGARQRRPASKRTLLLLTFFLGGSGAHRFYLGNYVLGTIYLLFFWTGIPVLIALVEFLSFLFTSSDSIADNYTAHGSKKAVVLVLSILGIFLVIFSLIGILRYFNDTLH